MIRPTMQRHLINEKVLFCDVDETKLHFHLTVLKQEQSIIAYLENYIKHNLKFVKLTTIDLLLKDGSNRRDIMLTGHADCLHNLLFTMERLIVALKESKIECIRVKIEAQFKNLEDLKNKIDFKNLQNTYLEFHIKTSVRFAETLPFKLSYNPKDNLDEWRIYNYRTNTLKGLKEIEYLKFIDSKLIRSIHHEVCLYDSNPDYDGEWI